MYRLYDLIRIEQRACNELLAILGLHGFHADRQIGWLLCWYGRNSMIGSSPTLGHMVLVSSSESLVSLVVQPLRSRSVMVTALESWEDMEYVLRQIRPDLVTICSSLMPRDWTVAQRSSLNKSKTPIVVLSNDTHPPSTLVVSRLNVVMTTYSGEEPVALVSAIRCLLDDIQTRARPRVLN